MYHELATLMALAVGEELSSAFWRALFRCLVIPTWLIEIDGQDVKANIRAMPVLMLQYDMPLNDAQHAEISRT